VDIGWEWFERPAIFDLSEFERDSQDLLGTRGVVLIVWVEVELTVIIVIGFGFARREDIFDWAAALFDALVGRDDLILMGTKLSDLALDVSFVWVARPH
jgi:hypothetical protein